MEYLSREELRELVGSPQRARQIAWLAREGWPFVVNCKGRVLVSRAYHDRRLGVAAGRADAPVPETTPLNLDAA
ncbi:DUF4224 domain-containing protein [Ralstonia mannitolilytica]|jgi:hypothetical protein|uniref:DUF4224 domain-containing protein n=1 Tax=Ralstonia mannitolilytica TaxID=105219 RepID=UPI00242ADD06|nr:DUF4224 domain-containing protein [Ralstonia mannitolilytica]CAJ0742873.1 hypothetical protein R76696_04200 [Ralstonia mannitolilytica]